MNVKITSKKMVTPQNFTEYAEQRLSAKLDKFFGDDADAKITLSEFKNQIVVELTVKFNNMIYRAEQSAIDKEDALDASIDKIIRQIRKNKTRLNRNVKENVREFNFDFDIKEEEEAKEKIVKRKDIEMKPMDEEEAILEMELLGHSFFVYKDMDTNNTCVLYKRKDGDYGLIETK